MHLLVQIPVIDMRGLVGEMTAMRLRRPTWPHANTATDPGRAEFLRHFGSLRETPAGEAGGWQGRAQHVDAAKVVKFSPVLNTYLRRTVWQGDWRHGAPQLLCTARRYFGSALSPRSFLQVRFRIDSTVKIQRTHHTLWGDPSKVEALMTSMAELPVRMNKSNEVALSQSGADLALAVRLATSRTAQLRQRELKWVVTSGRPLFIYWDEKRLIAEPPDTQSIASRGPHLDVRYISRTMHDEWFVRYEPGSSGTAYEQVLQLSRLHSERETLTALCRSIGLGLSDRTPNLSINSDALQRALLDSSQYLQRPRAFGNDQKSLLQAIDSDLVMHAAQWDAVRATLSSMRPQVRDHVTLSLTYIAGDQVGGDNFKNIKDSHIANRAAVVDAWNNLSGPDNEEIEQALRQLVAAVDEAGSAEAADAVEGLVAEVGGPRRPREISPLLLKLRELAPDASGLERVAEVILRMGR